MKRLFTLILITVSIEAFTQDDAATVANSTVHNNYRINFAIPDISAFKALEVDPSNILRPSTVKEVATSFSEFGSSGSFVIPKSFAIEIAPWLLFSENQTLSNYRESNFTRFLYNTKISIASRRSEEVDNFTSDLAIGLTFTLLGKDGDIKQGKFLNAKVVEEKTKLIVEYNKYFQEFLRAKDYMPFDDSDQEKMQEFEEYLFEQGYVAIESKVNEKIRKKINDFKKENWNHNRLDVAIAWKGSSADTLFKNLRSDDFNFWLTSSIKIQSWGQLLIGPNFQWQNLQSDSLKSVNVAIPFRFYGGTNRIKAFTEFQFKYEEIKETHFWFFNLGTEFNPVDGIWVELFAGWEKEKENDMMFVSRFNLRLSLPENFKLF